MNERNTAAQPHGEHGNAPAGSLQTILSYARQNYARQFVTLEAYRARAGSLLAFAAVLVAVSAGSAQRGAPSLSQAGGTVLVLASSVLFLIVSLGEGLRYAPSRRTLARSDVTAPVRETHERLLRGTLDVLDFNRRILGRLRALLFVGLLCLVAGMRLRPRFHCQPPPPFNVTPRRPCHP